MIDTTPGGAATLEPLPQHLDALARANTIRLEQALLKRRLKAGSLHVDALLVGAADLTDDERDAFERLTVMEFLRAPHRMGRARVRLLLSRLAALDPPVCLSEAKRVGSMTVRQRHVLAEEFRRRCPDSSAQRPI